MSGAIKRLPGETFASFSARQRAAQSEEAVVHQARRRRVQRVIKAASPYKEAWERNADHIDGYDRDDLGESPDY